MTNTDFLKVLTRLEDSFTTDVESAKVEYGAEAVATFQNFETYILGCSWTKSDNMKFIVMHREMTSEDLATEYEKEFGKSKAASTFRIQRADISRDLYGIFNENLEDIFYSRRVAELRDFNDKIKVLSMQVIDADSVFIDEVYEIANKPIKSERIVSIKDCEHDLQLLRVLTKESCNSILGYVDIFKLRYILNVLRSPLLRDEDGRSVLNNEKMLLLNSLSFTSTKASKGTVDLADMFKQVNNANSTAQRQIATMSTQLQSYKSKVEELTEENKRLKDALSVDDVVEDDSSNNGVSEEQLTEQERTEAILRNRRL